MPGLEKPTSERPAGGSIADRALAASVANLPPCFVMLVPVTALGVLISRDQVDTVRAIVWFLMSGLGSALGFMAFRSFHRRPPADPVDQHTMTLLLAAMAVAGLTLSLGTWVNPTSTRSVILMLTVIPASTTAVLAVVTAGRRDLFAAGLAPLTLVSVGTLLERDDYVLRRMAVLIGLGAVMMAILHHLISRTAEESIRGQIQTEQLAAQLERDHHAVADANTELAQSNDRLLHRPCTTR